MRMGQWWLEAISILLLAVLIVPTRAVEPESSSAKGTPKSEAEQIAGIAERLDVIGPGLINQISFTMLHSGGDSDAFLTAVGSPDEHGKGFSYAAAVREAGGLAKYRRRVAELLTSESPLTRGYGAQWLGMVGDDTCKDDLLRLLKTKSAVHQDGIEGFDREMAAIALGILKVKECAGELAPLLEDPNGRVRAGAATGLGLLKATEYTDAIAKSLDYRSEFDPRAEEASAGAILALVALDAKQYAPTIARSLTEHGDVKDIAIYALVALDAKEQTKDIVALLNDDFKGGEAALALALMGDTEHTDSIRDLVNKNKDFGFVRCKAAIALGILRAENSASDIAKLMRSSEACERATAAWALILLEDKEHAAEAVAIIGQDGEEKFFSCWVPERGGAIVGDQLSKVGDRAVQSLRKLREEVEPDKGAEKMKESR